MSEKTEQFLATLTNESEAFGLLGHGYPNSFYKLYVRATNTSGWWCFQEDAGPTKMDPMKYQAGVKVSGRAIAVWAPLRALADYEHHPERAALGKLLDRAKELAKEPK